MWNKVKALRNLAQENMNKLDELMWANIYNTSIKNSTWWNRPINPGRWAVNYAFLYVLFRVLDEIEPEKILELGLGQSTVMTTSYVNTKKICSTHEIVEHDKEWIDFFCRKIDLELGHINQLELITEKFLGNEVIKYAGIESCMKNEYNLVLIDAPFGSEHLSRVDIIEYIPQCLAKSFVIMMHDYNRLGEKNTVELICRRLREHNINYHTGFYNGTAHTCVITSEDLKFVCSL